MYDTINFIKTQLANPLFLKIENKNYEKIVKFENGRVVLDTIRILNPNIPTYVFVKNKTKVYKFTIN